MIKEYVLSLTNLSLNLMSCKKLKLFVKQEVENETLSTIRLCHMLNSKVEYKLFFLLILFNFINWANFH